MFKKLFLVIMAVSMLSIPGVLAAENVNFRVEGESCSDTNADLNYAWDVSLSGNTTLSLYAGTPASGDTYYYNYKVNVPTDGIYTMLCATSVQGGLSGENGVSGPEYLSSYSIRINDENTYEAAIFRIESYLPTVGDIPYNRYLANVFLKAGSNNVQFLVNKAGNGSYVFKLDYMDFLLKTKSFDASDIRMEGEAFSQYKVAPNYAWDAAFSGGVSRIFYVSSTDYPDGITERYYITAASDGIYSVNVASIALGTAWSSDFSLVVNGDSTVYADGTAAWMQTITGDGAYVKYGLKNTVSLKRGVNTIDLVIKDKRDDGLYITYLDYIDFIKVQRPDTYVIEAETCTSSSFTVDANGDFSGGGDLVAWTSAAGDYSTSYNFNIKKDGYYKLYLQMSGFTMGNEYFSPAEIRFDDNEFVKLTSGNTTWVSIISPNLPSDQYGRFVYNDDVYLTQGEHTFNLRVVETAPLQNPPLYGFRFDRFDLCKAQDECAKVDAQAGNTLLSIGETTNVAVYPVDGDENLLYDGTYMVTYTSTNERVAAVDADGVITAKNYGTADINVCLVKDGSSDEIIVPVRVSVVSGFDIKSIEPSENGTGISVNVNFVKYTASTDSGTMILASYGAGGTVKNVSVQSIETINAGIDNIKTITLDSVDAGDKVKLFVWNSADGLKPLWTDTLIRE